ncbi:MAG TPA: plastocyanin/azurin family copper-binding protein [Candidatus Limnocylindrales bacterium]|jgi:uncharacterized cupredoxin-like copper-binding protein
MDSDHQQRGVHAIPSWFVLAIAIIALIVGAVALTATLTNRSSPFSMMGGAGAGMMGTRPVVDPANAPQPGEPGFVAGTAASPRVIRLTAGPAPAFSPSAVSVARGETITFEVTTMGPTAHEFMVGPADAVAADEEGTPEVADIGMMQTKSLTYTFDGAGPYAFACHVTGHYEAGMRGTIAIVAP